MRSYSVTVTMTPRQAIEAEYLLRLAAVQKESGRGFSAGSRIASGLYDAGWDRVQTGTDDDPRWVWRLGRGETP